MEQMSLQNQYDIDKDHFVELFSKFTGVSKTKLFNFLDSHSVATLFEHPASLNISDSQRIKIEQLKELRNLYGNLKSFDKAYLIDQSSKAFAYFKEFFAEVKDKERFVCAFLDNGNRIISTQIMTTGTVNEAAVYPREIVKSALLCDAKSVILAHNHPGGSITPSAPDVAVTMKIGDALSTLNISVLDHIIIADDKFASFAEKGLSFTSDQNSVFESSSPSMHEKIVSQYSSEFPAIKHISKRTAQLINALNVQQDKCLSIKDIRQSYIAEGKKLDQCTPSTADVQSFNFLKEVVDDLKNAQLVNKQDIAHAKSLQNPLPNHTITVEM